MHIVHFILLEMPEENFSEREIESSLQDALSESGGSWYDYYVPGGRWSTYFEDFAEETDLKLQSPFPYFMPYRNNEALFVKALERASNKQNKTFREARDHLTGGVVAFADHEEGVFGIQTTTDKETSERLTKLNKDTSKEWEKILKSDDLESLRESNPFNMGVYYAKRLVDIIYDHWFTESHYYDAVGYTTNPNHVKLSLPEGAAHPEHPGYPQPYDKENLVLVAVDFHY